MILHRKFNPSLNLLLQYLNQNLQTMKYLIRSSKSFWQTQNVLLRINRRHTYFNFLATRDSLHTCYTGGQNTDGNTKTSILDVIRREQLSPCLRSKTVTALEATPRLSGRLLVFWNLYFKNVMKVNILVIMMPCCLTSLANVTSSIKEQVMRYIAWKKLDLILVAVI